MLSASEIDEEARFTMIHANTVVARASRDSGPEWWVARVGYEGTRVFPVEWPDAVGDVRVVAVGGGPTLFDESRATGALAVGCDDLGCRVLVAEGEATTLTPVEGFDFPAGVFVSSMDRLTCWCAAADAVYCWDTEENRWVPDSPEASVSLVVASSSFEYTRVAAGAAGTLLVNWDRFWPSVYWYRDSPEQQEALSVARSGCIPGQGEGWREVYTGATSTFTAVAAGSHDVAALADDGSWTVVSIPDGGGIAMATCVQSPPLLAMGMGLDDGGEPWLVVDSTGMAYSEQRSDDSEPYRWCAWSTQPVEGIVGASCCSTSKTALAITPTEVLSLGGQTDCH